MSYRPPRHPLSRTTAGKPPSQRGHGTLRPKETDPGSTQHTDCRVPPTERTSDTGLAPSLVGLVNRVANESLLIEVRVIAALAALAAEDQRTGKPRMPELPVGAFACRSEDKPGTLKLGDQLSDLARRDQKMPHPPSFRQPHSQLRSPSRLGCSEFIIHPSTFILSEAPSSTSPPTALPPLRLGRSDESISPSPTSGPPTAVHAPRSAAPANRCAAASATPPGPAPDSPPASDARTTHCSSVECRAANTRAVNTHPQPTRPESCRSIPLRTSRRDQMVLRLEGSS